MSDIHLVTIWFSGDFQLIFIWSRTDLHTVHITNITYNSHITDIPSLLIHFNKKFTALSYHNRLYPNDSKDIVFKCSSKELIFSYRTCYISLRLVTVCSSSDSNLEPIWYPFPSVLNLVSIRSLSLTYGHGTSIWFELGFNQRLTLGFLNNVWIHFNKKFTAHLILHRTVPYQFNRYNPWNNWHFIPSAWISSYTRHVVCLAFPQISIDFERQLET